MRRYIRSYRTRQNIRNTSALRTQFLQELQKEAQKILKDLTDQFTTEAQGQASQILQSMLSSTSGGASGDIALDADATKDMARISSIGQLLSTGVRYLISRPRTSTNTMESARSIDVDTQFRLSRAQALAEAQATMNKGEKNA